MNNLYKDLVIEIIKTLSYDSLAIVCEINKDYRKLTDDHIKKNILNREVSYHNLRYLKQYPLLARGQRDRESINYIYFNDMVLFGRLKNIKWLKKQGYTWADNATQLGAVHYKFLKETGTFYGLSDSFSYALMNEYESNKIIKWLKKNKCPRCVYSTDPMYYKSNLD